MSVTANTATRSATSPWLMKRFSPLITPIVAVALGARAHARSVRTGTRLSQREGSQLLAGGQVRQPALLLLVRAAMHERQRAKLLHGRDQAAGRADLAELLDDEQH